MDDKRRQELYAQLKIILAELLYEKKVILPKVLEQGDPSILKIHARESIGTKERMLH